MSRDFIVKEDVQFQDINNEVVRVRDNTEEITLGEVSLKVTYSKMNVHVENSFLIKEDALKKKFIDLIIMNGKLLGFEYKRTFESWLREWKAHNTLYNWNYKRERTASVDLNEDESFIKRLCYFFLALFEVY